MSAGDQLETGTTPLESEYTIKGIVPEKYIKKLYAIKVINDADCKSFLDLDSARHTIRRIPDGVEGAAGLPAQLKLPNSVSTRSFVKLMNVLKFQDAAMVSESMLYRLFKCQLSAIAMFCNDAVISFIKTLAKTPDHILSFMLDVGDDGDYKWMAQEQVNKLFSAFMEYKKKDPKKLESISPHLKSYVFEHSDSVAIAGTFGQKRPRLP
jgi:hypothetical protein